MGTDCNDEISFQKNDIIKCAPYNPRSVSKQSTTLQTEWHRFATPILRVFVMFVRKFENWKRFHSMDSITICVAAETKHVYFVYMSSATALLPRFLNSFARFEVKRSVRHFTVAHRKHQRMANSKFGYVRDYEVATEHYLLKNSFIVVRLDGHNFHRFVETHNFFKPNDKRGLDLMVESAKQVMREFYPNIAIAYGQSDEFSFVFRRDAEMYKRRQNKITSILVSIFTSSYVFHWNKYFNSFPEKESHLNVELQYPPSFDARCVLYPTVEEVIDYLKWRQVDCHVNNLYNTTLSAMTGDYNTWPLEDKRPTGDFKFYTSREATEKLSRTVKKDKHEIMFSDYKINYNNELEQFKKGTVLTFRYNKEEDNVKDRNDGVTLEEKKNSMLISVRNDDIIKGPFWETHMDLLV